MRSRKAATKARKAATKEMERRAETAYHESGHLVAAAVLDLYPENATIERDGDVLGRVIHPSVVGFEIKTRTELKQVVRDIIIVCYAGFEAQRMYNPQADDSGSQNDFQNALNLSSEYPVLPRTTREVGDKVQMAYLDRRRREARSLIRRNRNKVQALAEALLKKPTLTGEEAARIIANTP